MDKRAAAAGVPSAAPTAVPLLGGNPLNTAAVPAFASALTIMFLGEYEHSLDGKGRLAIPARFRPQLAEGAVITRGLDRCLAIYSAEAWRALAERLVSLPTSRADVRTLQRLQFSGAAACDFDRQGRIVVPAYLRAYAGIQDAVVVVGLYTRIEVWDRDAWTNVKLEAEARGGEIAEQLADLGL